MLLDRMRTVGVRGRRVWTTARGRLGRRPASFAVGSTDEFRRHGFEIERWFIRQGMPFVIRDRKRHPASARMLPVLVFLTVYSSLIYALLPLSSRRIVQGATTVNAESVEAGIAILLSMLISSGIALAATLIYLWIRRGRPALLTRTAGATGVAAYLVIPTAITAIAVGGAVPWIDLVAVVALLAVMYLLVITGIAALVAWAARHAVLHFAAMLGVSTRAIPLLLLLVVFLFITAENWQMSAALSRPPLWGIAWFFIAAVLVFLLIHLPKELRNLRIGSDPERIVAACLRTPLAPWATRLTGGDGSANKPPLRRKERWNVIARLVLAQCMQVLLLAVTVFLVFLIFGKIAIAESVMRAWVGSDIHPGVLFGLPIPFPNELIQVCIVISAVTALYFAVYTVTDYTYRAAFFDEALKELEDRLLARECYLTVRSQHGTADPSGTAS